MKISTHKNFLLGLILSPVAAVLLIGALLTGCSFVGGQADKRLGEACTPEVRLLRAALFTDLMHAHFNKEVPAQIKQLSQKLDLMAEALTAGAGLDAAGDAYKLTFVKTVLVLAAKRGEEISLRGMDEAVDWLRSIPERAVVIAADVNGIEARVQIACAGLAKQTG